MAESCMSLRSTQRVPRSCIPCSSRKVRCDKAEPCGTCVRRGEQHLCFRETVLIRGEPKTWHETQRDATSEALLQEIDRLREEISALRYSHESTPCSSCMTPDSRRSRQSQESDSIEDAFWSSLELKTDILGPQVSNWDDVILPSRALSNHLIAYDRMWNSWVHYAVEYPRFQQQCDDFMDATEGGLPLCDYDPFWKAVYFSLICAALLMMDDSKAADLLASEHIGVDAKRLARNWYDAAIFSLHRADFLRVAHISTVQSVAILGICFNIFGDTTLSHHMWSIAIRVGQRLGLDAPSSEHAGGLTTVAQQRLWWTITICEWLNASHKSPQIEEVSFEVPLSLPAVTSQMESTEELDPSHYHLFMARIARVYYRFRKAIHAGALAADVVVRAADEELALIIDTLPAHLQPGPGSPRNVNYLESSQPWIKWQRFDITLVLLHHRIRINRTLQPDWLASPEKYAWARAICIQSSMDTIWISQNWDQPVSMRKQWALSYHLFVASVVLLREWRESRHGHGGEYVEAIEASISILEQIQSQNELALHAVRILRDYMTM